MGVIEVAHLTKDYGHGRGVFDVSFEIERGEVYGFLGPNGAGKTTTIRHLMGFSKPQSGCARINGKNCFTHYSEILANVGYVPGEISLPAGLSCREFIDMNKRMKRVKSDTLLRRLLDIFELSPDRSSRRISLGDKRKLAIITAFMADPEVLILDEPTSGLDPLMQEVFIEFVKGQKAAGKTIMLSSHMFNEIEGSCDRIAIIKNGVIISECVAAELSKEQSLEQRFLHFYSEGA